MHVVGRAVSDIWLNGYLVDGVVGEVERRYGFAYGLVRNAQRDRVSMYIYS